MQKFTKENIVYKLKGQNVVLMFVWLKFVRQNYQQKIPDFLKNSTNFQSTENCSHLM